MPGSFFGLVLFAAFVLPGYVWVRAAERLRPRPDRSGLTETAELLFVGVIASSIASAIVMWIGDLGFEPVIRDGVEYLDDDPQLAAITAACIFGVSIALTGLAALVFFWRPGADGTLRPGSTPWYDALTRASRGRKVLVKVHLGDDEYVLGKLGSYTVDPEASAPDLVLHSQITVQTGKDVETVRLGVDSILIRGVEIRDVQIRYQGEGKRSLGDRLRSWLCDRIGGADRRAAADTDEDVGKRPMTSEQTGR